MEADRQAIRQFLDNPDHLIFVCPHHDIGEAAGLVEEDRVECQIAEYRHHGDHAIPPRQGFGGFARMRGEEGRDRQATCRVERAIDIGVHLAVGDKKNHLHDVRSGTSSDEWENPDL